MPYDQDGKIQITRRHHWIPSKRQLLRYLDKRDLTQSCDWCVTIEDVDFILIDVDGCCCHSNGTSLNAHCDLNHRNCFGIIVIVGFHWIEKENSKGYSINKGTLFQDFIGSCISRETKHITGFVYKWNEDIAHVH